MLAYHVRSTTAALDRVEQAARLPRGPGPGPARPVSAYARILRTEGEFLRGVGNSYLYHEHLEETNQPVYFHEFIGRARARGLRFLAEPRTPGLIDNLPPEARGSPGRLGGRRDRPRAIPRLPLQPDLPADPALPRRQAKRRPAPSPEALARCGSARTSCPRPRCPTSPPTPPRSSAGPTERPR